MSTEATPRPRSAAWQHRLATGVAGLLVFETLTGLSIYLLPFSVSNQFTVLFHTVVGIAFVLPFALYQLRHWRAYRALPMTHVKLTGYFAMASTLAAVVSGLVLTYQAAFGTRISYAWDLVHLVATFALVASALPHVVAIVVRNLRGRAAAAMQPVLAAQTHYGARIVYWTLTLSAFVALAAYAYEPAPLTAALPEDYNYLYGTERPFAPSLARTASGGAVDARALGGSQTCGRAGCHVEIVDEWEVSAHRWAAMDPAFREVQRTMGEQNGPESTRYCGGCHDPISLFSGSKNLFRDELTNPMGMDEGVSCMACHGIEESDVKGNADYVMGTPERYVFEMDEGAAPALVSSFLIRAYPEQHVESLQRRLFKSPEFCGACHKQFIDEEINNVGWVQLQNQYDNWRKSRWNHPGDAAKTVECRECHMPLVASFDPASGDAADYNRSPDDGMHRSHRFLGANQFVPRVLDLPGGEEQAEMTVRWLRGEIDIPEIADKWKTGPAVPVTLSAPEAVAPGEPVELVVTVTNNKVGHDFPTGPLDIIQAWIEVTVTDARGHEVFSSGRRDDGHFIEPGTFMFKAEPVDRYGNLIDRHNLWEMVGVRYRRSLFPGFSDQARYTFTCPGTTPGAAASDSSTALPERSTVAFTAPPDGGRLHVRAQLMYRKVDQYLLNTLFGEEAAMTSPVTVLSSDERSIAVAAP